MTGRPVPIDRLEISLRRRHLDEIMGRAIEGPRPADAEIGTGGCDQRLGLRLDQARRRWRCSDADFFGQALALVRVEDGEALEERDHAGLFAGLPGPPALVLRREAVGVDNGRAALALSDVAAETKGLTEGEPALAGKAVLDHGAPEDQDVDP